jgi:hypothetical protein
VLLPRRFRFSPLFLHFLHEGLVRNFSLKYESAIAAFTEDVLSVAQTIKDFPALRRVGASNVLAERILVICAPIKDAKIC